MPHSHRGRVRLVLGAPGTGKTRTLLDTALNFLREGDPARLLVLTPSRAGAGRFREQLVAETEATLSVSPVRAWQAYAFDLLRRGHMAGLLPGLDFSPKLLSGPEQDVMITELLAGHARGLGAAVSWPEYLSEALGTRGFRHEVRDFFDRMAEYNLSAEQVRDMGLRQQRPEWVAVADLYREYRQIRRLRMPNAFDPAALINEAADLLARHPDFLADERGRLDTVLIDDMQEATPSIYRLLDVLCSAQSSRVVPPALVITACTDTVVQGFRGARPDLTGSLPKIFPGLERVQLEVSHRMPAGIARAWEAVAARLPQVAAAAHSRDLSQPAEQGPPAEVPLWELGNDGSLLDTERSQDTEEQVLGFTLGSAQQEARLLAQMILEDRLYRGRAFSRSVIIVRRGATVSQLSRILEGQGIPVTTSQALRPVRDEPAVRPFLDSLALLVKDRVPGLGIDTALALLTSRLGGASPMDIRRLRQSLRAQELRAGGRRGSDELVVEALLQPEKLPAGRVSEAAHRISRVLEAGKKALRVPGATAETVLWELWSASGLAKTWRELALLGQAAGERAHRDLDAVIGLFEAAARYVDQMPGATAEQFLDYIDAQELPMDTLTERASTVDAVEILTPALAAGRSWDTVYIAGVQDGVWPNTTVRGTLLGSQDLTDIFELGAEAGSGIKTLDRVRETRFDELRMFSTAVSRARHKLVVTAVSSAEELPSELLDTVAPAGGVRGNTAVRRPMTLRAMIAELRRWSEAEDTDPLRADAAAKILHRFNDPEQTAGLTLPGADPDRWWGLLPLSSTEATFDERAVVPVSPSQVETIHRSPLDWFVSAARAEEATDLARSIGNLVHELAEDMPDWDAQTVSDSESFRTHIVRELRTRFDRLGLADTWETRVVYERAEKMILKFVDYVADLHTDARRELVGVEGAFSVHIAGPHREALLQGRVDRLERDLENHKYVIVDLKTGKSAPAQKELAEHPQLAAYQIALEAGAGQVMAESTGEDYRQRGEQQTLRFEGLHEESGGAYLVQIGKDTKKYGAQEQPALSTDAQWAVDLINRAADLIAVRHLQARHDSSSGSKYGRSCRLPEICPLCARGRQVTQG